MNLNHLTRDWAKLRPHMKVQSFVGGDFVQPIVVMRQNGRGVLEKWRLVGAGSILSWLRRMKEPDQGVSSIGF